MPCNVHYGANHSLFKSITNSITKSGITFRRNIIFRAQHCHCTFRPSFVSFHPSFGPSSKCHFHKYGVEYLVFQGKT